MKKFKHNGDFAILKGPYNKKQHQNQQCGMDKYVDVLDFCTGLVNSVKLYENGKGVHFKKGGANYLHEFTSECEIQAYRVTDSCGDIISSDSVLIGLIGEVE